MLSDSKHRSFDNRQPAQVKIVAAEGSLEINTNLSGCDIKKSQKRRLSKHLRSKASPADPKSAQCTFDTHRGFPTTMAVMHVYAYKHTLEGIMIQPTDTRLMMNH